MLTLRLIQMDSQEKAALEERYSYYANNESALLGYYDCGIVIPETRKPGEIYHARLGSMHELEAHFGVKARDGYLG